MEYGLYENSDVLLEDSPNSKKSWLLLNTDNSMENNEEYFGWNTLKIDEEKFEGSSEKIETRKRKLSPSMGDEGKIKRANNFKVVCKDPLALEEKSELKKAQKGASRMPNWQVDDYGDINADIDSSLSLGSDLANNSYNVGESILSINGLTVFKQEVPSPSSNEIASLQVARQSRQSPTSTQGPVANNAGCNMEDNSQTMFNNTINQLLSQTGLVNLQNVMDNNLASPSSQDNYNVSSTNYNYVDDCRFQYVLAAATSIATKINEDTLTYLNQGQSYEIKLKKLGDLSMYRGKILKSVIRICFHERRLQYMEKEQMTLWQKARPGDRILEADVPLSYGTYDIVQPNNALNVIHFSWDPTKEVGVYIKVNCISTEFTPKKHGGEKGVPFRIQVETYQNGDVLDVGKRLHAAACQIKVFKLKGADRKHKQDREKIMKRPILEQEKFQPSYDCTVLNDIPSEAVLSTPPIAPLAETNAPQSQQPVVQQKKVETIPAVVSAVAIVAKPIASVKNFAKNSNCEVNDQLSVNSTPEETTEWLTSNRFERHIQDFMNFSGSDMFRMSREDFIQICGHADGIRLFNILHSRTITPKLKIYVCRENSTVFNAIFLSSYSNEELIKKLSTLLGISEQRVRDIYMEGPQSIHVHLNNDLLKHIKEDTMFMLEIMQESDEYVLLLKRAIN